MCVCVSTYVCACARVCVCVRIYLRPSCTHTYNTNCTLRRYSHSYWPACMHACIHLQTCMHTYVHIHIMYIMSYRQIVLAIRTAPAQALGQGHWLHRGDDGDKPRHRMLLVWCRLLHKRSRQLVAKIQH